jgi:hypothetical protein
LQSPVGQQRVGRATAAAGARIRDAGHAERPRRADRRGPGAGQKLTAIQAHLSDQ